MYPNARRIEGPGIPECSWKTPLDHRDLWKKSPQEASGAIFSGPEALRMDIHDFRSHQRRAQRLSLLAEDDPKVQ